VEQVRAEAPEQTPTKSGYVEGHLFIARTARMRTVALPAHLQSHLSAPRYDMRMAAAYGLRMLLEDQNPAMALAAREALEKLRKEDESQRVRDEAAKYLAAHDGGRSSVAQPIKQRGAQPEEKAKAEIAQRPPKKIEEKRAVVTDEARRAAQESAAERVLERTRRRRERIAEQRRLAQQKRVEMQEAYPKIAPAEAIKEKPAAPVFGNSKSILFATPEATSEELPGTNENTSSSWEIVTLVIAIPVINALGAWVGAQMVNLRVMQFFTTHFDSWLPLVLPGAVLGVLYRMFFDFLLGKRFRPAVLAMWPGFLVGFEFLSKAAPGSQPSWWMPTTGILAFVIAAFWEG